MAKLFGALAVMFLVLGFANASDENKALEAAGKGAVLVPGGANLATLVGFGGSGIVKGTIAPVIQSVVGTGVVFSGLQSLGATGALAVLGGPVGMGVGAIVGIGGYYFFG